MRCFAVVPAAGKSRRMGRAKLLMSWGDATVIEAVLDAWLASGVERVVVTVAPGDEQLARLCAARGVDVIFPPTPPPEMKDSVLLALRHLQATAHPDDNDAWLLAPADGIGLSAAAVDLVIRGYREALIEAGTARIVVPCLDGRRGHPVAFPWRLVDEAERLGDDEGLNVLVRRHEIVEVDVAGTLGDQAERIFIDLDTPEDYRRLGGGERGE
ncbi:MAG: nucleotidyltransferase family protein [Planctomycetales bacterium]|nr:nucleotidyltransferase family protein [Planctomycetales bacterium]